MIQVSSFDILIRSQFAAQMCEGLDMEQWFPLLDLMRLAILKNEAKDTVLTNIGKYFTVCANYSYVNRQNILHSWPNLQSPERRRCAKSYYSYGLASGQLILLIN